MRASAFGHRVGNRTCHGRMHRRRGQHSILHFSGHLTRDTYRQQLHTAAALLQKILLVGPAPREHLVRVHPNLAGHPRHRSAWASVASTMSRFCSRVNNCRRPPRRVVPLTLTPLQLDRCPPIISRWAHRTLTDCVPEPNATKSQIDQKPCDQIPPCDPSLQHQFRQMAMLAGFAIALAFHLEPLVANLPLAATDARRSSRLSNHSGKRSAGSPKRQATSTR
jgi:hypothetical protein